MADQRTLEEVEEEMTVEVKPGDDCDTCLTFPTRGNEAYSYHQAALKVKFALNDSANCQYKRCGNDLIYTHSISLEEALVARPVQLKTLDQRNLILSIDQTITPQLVHCVKGEGMPCKEDSTKRGDLHIKFNIIFPQVLKTEHRQEILKVLDQ